MVAKLAPSVRPAVLIVFVSSSLGCPPPSTSDVFIGRDFADGFERSLIATAESVCPARDAVLALATPEVPANLPDETECLWWYELRGEVRWPYAITEDLIQYYVDLIGERIRQEDIGGVSFDGYWSFFYRAYVESGVEVVVDGETVRDAFAVHMSASLWSPDGDFFKDRTVILSSDGEPVFVFGDGETETPVYVAKRAESF